MENINNIKTKTLKNNPLDVTLYTVKDIQEIFKCGRKKSYEIMHIASFPSFKIDEKLYVEKTELEKWISKIRNKNINT